MVRTLLGVLVIIVALAGSMWLLFGPGAAPYMGVSELLSRQAEMVGRPMRLAGRLHEVVAPKEVGDAMQLIISEGEARITVEYGGRQPNDLQPGREVLFDGHLNENGVFVAHHLLTQCTSRYKARLDNADQRPAQQ